MEAMKTQGVVTGTQSQPETVLFVPRWQYTVSGRIHKNSTLGVPTIEKPDLIQVCMVSCCAGSWAFFHSISSTAVGTSTAKVSFGDLRVRMNCSSAVAVKNRGGSKRNERVRSDG